MTRQICVAVGIIVFVMQGSALLADESQDAQIQALTDKTYQLDKRVKQLEDIAAKNRSASLRKRFEARLEQDQTTYNQQELKEIESLYQIANKQWNSPEVKESLKKLTDKYTKANRTGCALLYLGQMATGEEKENYLKRAINEFDDCWYGDGVQVGAYARFYLANHYLVGGKEAEASAIFDEIRRIYPDAINHVGQLLADIMYQRADKSETNEIGKISTVKRPRKITLNKNHILILPLVILVLAVIYRLFPPKKINRYYGYRTKLSMKNQDAWDVANKLSANVLLIGAIAYFLVVMFCIVVICFPSQSLMVNILLWMSVASLILMLFGVIVITEWRLRKTFDASGKRINPDQDSYVRFSSLSKWRKIELVGIVVIMAIVLVYIAYVMRYFFIEVGSGAIFKAQFIRGHPGYDVGAIEARFLAFTLLAAIGLPYLAIVRWISDRATRFTYWAFVVQATVLCLFPLFILSSALYRHLLYINAYGFTTLRICGLVYGLVGYILMLGFLYWAVQVHMSENTRRHVAVRWFAPVAFVIILGLLIVLVNFQTWTAQYYCLKMINHQQVTKECIELLRTTQFTNEIKIITYLPQKNWSSLPSGLRKLNLELINIEKQSVVLRKSRAAILVFMPSKTNDSTWELMFYGYSPLYQIKRKILAVEP